VKIQIQGKCLRKYIGKEREKRKADAEDNRKDSKKKREQEGTGIKETRTRVK